MLFGGGDGWASYTNVTWVFERGSWSKQVASGPGPRSSGGMALLRGNNVIFGGIGERDPSSPAEGLGDTYEWDGEAWTERAVAGPSPRWSHEMATLGDTVVLFGGYNLAERYLGETWVWNGEQWTKRDVAGPPGRVAHAMATVGDRILLFGGQTEHGTVGDTWVWDGERWTEVVVSPSPSPRTGHAMAGGPTKALLFGGGRSDETWEWDERGWSQHHVAGPSARGSAGMARWGSHVLLFGGLRLIGNTYDYLADTWQWDGARWQKLDVSGPEGLANPFMSER